MKILFATILLSLSISLAMGQENNARPEEKEMTQKQLAILIGVSPSRINDYVNGRAEPSLKIARLLCKTLGITPAAMLGA